MFSEIPLVGHGVGLKPAHYADIFARPGAVDWYEAISENYMASYGRAIRMLEQVREHHPVGLHGVSMSLGSVGGINEQHLAALAELVAHIDPFVVSDHLCFTSAGGHYSHDLLPLPLTHEAIDVAVANIAQVQDRLKRPIIVENVSSYVRSRSDEMSEADFVREVVLRAGCGLLLDVNNVIVNAHNHAYDPRAFIDRMPAERVAEIHLAGHSRRDDYLFDDHIGPTPDAVWDLFAYTIEKTGPVNTLIEWDTDVPPFEILAGESAKARRLVMGRP